MLQAAEIERLNKFLQEYQIRYRELERKELDRHSYEIQIKELTEKLRGEQHLKMEVQKLNDFIKRLSVNILSFRLKTKNSKEIVEQVRAIQVTMKGLLAKLTAF